MQSGLCLSACFQLPGDAHVPRLYRDGGVRCTGAGYSIQLSLQLQTQQTAFSDGPDSLGCVCYIQLNSCIQANKAQPPRQVGRFTAVGIRFYVIRYVLLTAVQLYSVDRRRYGCDTVDLLDGAPRARGAERSNGRGEETGP